MIWILTLVFAIPMFWILFLYLDFEGAKNFHVLKVLTLGFGGCWRFLTVVWHLHLNLDMALGLWYTHDPNFGSLSWFWGCKEHPSPLSPHLGLWRMLKVQDWGSASCSWFGDDHWTLVHPYSEFWLSILILKVQRTSMSFKSWSGALEDAGGSWRGFGILILIWIWTLVFDTPMIQSLALYLDFEGAKNIHVL